MTFTDKTERTWTPELSFGVIRAIKLATDIDLGDIGALPKSWGRIVFNDETALNVVWQTIRESAEAKGVTHADYLAAMDGDTLHAALTALEGVVGNFTHPRDHRAAKRAMRMVNQVKATTLATSEVMATIKLRMDRIGNAATKAMRTLRKRYGI